MGWEGERDERLVINRLMKISCFDIWNQNVAIGNIIIINNDKDNVKCDSLFQVSLRKVLDLTPVISLPALCYVSDRVILLDQRTFIN